jgi:hypothetical protein
MAAISFAASGLVGITPTGANREGAGGTKEGAEPNIEGADPNISAMKTIIIFASPNKLIS